MSLNITTVLPYEFLLPRHDLLPKRGKKKASMAYDVKKIAKGRVRKKDTEQPYHKKIGSLFDDLKTTLLEGGVLSPGIKLSKVLILQLALDVIQSGKLEREIDKTLGSANINPKVKHLFRSLKDCFNNPKLSHSETLNLVIQRIHFLKTNPRFFEMPELSGKEIEEALGKAPLVSFNLTTSKELAELVRIKFGEISESANCGYLLPL